jgi:hypothetical protein
MVEAAQIFIANVVVPVIQGVFKLSVGTINGRSKFLDVQKSEREDMRVITKAVYQMTEKIGEYILIEEHTYPYEGPVAECLRQAAAQAGQAASTAAGVGAQLGNEAQGELGTLSPFYSREMQAEHSLDPNQINEMLTAAGAGAGATTGAIGAQMQRQAANTGNAAGATKGLQELARDRMKANAGTSEGIASQDILGAQKLRQEGAQGEQGLYGSNLKAQLDAMGQVSGDINAQVNANKTGWLQNAEGLGKTVASIAAM